jgi:hypothetical protein
MSDVGFDRLDRKLRAFGQEFQGDRLRRIMRDVGMESKGDVDKAVRSDLGDLSMSGWRRGRPIQITGRFDLGRRAGDVEISPQKRARGPMRVLEQGRNKGSGFGFAGPGINTRTGVTSFTASGRVRQQRSRRGRRWNGYTAGKGTWSDAVKIMERQTPPRVAKAVRRALVQTFRG